MEQLAKADYCMYSFEDEEACQLASERESARLIYGLREARIRISSWNSWGYEDIIREELVYK